MAERDIAVQEQFEDLEQQQETARLGLWLFLATEVLFFGGAFMAYATYYIVYPAGFAHGIKNTSLLLGSINTALLLTSSLTVALSVNAIQRDNVKRCRHWLWLTILLGVLFLAVKGVEYAEDIEKRLVPGAGFPLPERPGSELFFLLYWILTGLHSVHLLIGIGALTVVAWMVSRDRFSARYYTPVELTALYWGFVDIVWIYLYPMLYLIDRHV